jgi:predicted NAD/FAD-dependent oxidoreductase
MKYDQKGIAIIGSGLAGLTAAHFIRQWSGLPITNFETLERDGGRVLTSTTPPGEHGARYFLGSELNVKPGCVYWRDYGLPFSGAWQGLLRLV